MDLLAFQFISTLAIAYAVVKWLLMGLLVTTSRIWNHTRFAVPLVIGVITTAIGMLFKIEHWPIADELMIIGAALMTGSYAFWYRKKGVYRLIDNLKLGWMLGVSATVIAMAFHVWVKPIAGLTDAIFWAVALLFIYQRWIRRRKQPSS